MKTLRYFLKGTQETLFKRILKIFGDKAVANDGNFILVPGEVPVMLVAHLDTVHEKVVREIITENDGNILSSPQGIGGDDRCGVYALCKIYETVEKKPYLLFTCNEEIGRQGAQEFCRVHRLGQLPAELDALKFLIEIDRKGANDAVYYNCQNFEFENYISSKGFVTDTGSFSDISNIAPELGVAAVNLSSGYHNAHKLNEYINCNELEHTIERVIKILGEAAQDDFPRYEFL